MKTTWILIWYISIYNFHLCYKKTETPGSLLENVWDIFFKTHHGCSGHLPDIKQLQHVVQAWAISKQWQFYTPPEMQKKCISQPLGNHYHDISCSNDIKCSFLHGNLQSCNYNNNNLTTKKQKTTAEGGHQLFFPCVFPAEKSQTKSRFNDLSGAVAAEFPGLMISMVASATPSGKKSHGKREILKW